MPTGGSLKVERKSAGFSPRVFSGGSVAEQREQLEQFQRNIKEEFLRIQTILDNITIITATVPSNQAQLDALDATVDTMTLTLNNLVNLVNLNMLNLTASIGLVDTENDTRYDLLNQTMNLLSSSVGLLSVSLTRLQQRFEDNVQDDIRPYRKPLVNTINNERYV